MTNNNGIQDEALKQLRLIYERFAKSSKPINRAYLESVHALINLTETNDPYTKRHSVKVSNYAGLLSRAIGMSKKEVDSVKLAAILHDIGKVGIRVKILLKNGALNHAEYEEVKKHSEIGADIAKPLKFFNEVIYMIKHHHENYNGTGYPDGLEGASIPLGSRILAIADAYDALTSTRAYRKAYSSEKAIGIMKSESGKKFDPVLLETFLESLERRKKESGK